MRSIKDFAFEGYRFAAQKVGISIAFTDDFGIQSIIYPWENLPTWKLRGRHNMRKEYAALDLLVPRASVTADIGAHVGIFSMMLARKSERVYAFEPTPESYQCMVKNFELNSLSNVVPVQKALSDKSGMSTFHLFSSDQAELNSLGNAETGYAVEQSVEVETISLDDFAEQQKIREFDFVKIDVEGSELNVLRGAGGLLQRKEIKIFSFETTKYQFADGKKKPGEVYDFVSSFGYVVRRFDSKDNAFLPVDRDYNPMLDNLYSFSDPSLIPASKNL